MSDSAARFAAAARALVGVPWRHRGRTRRGLDCIGLLVAAAQHAGMHTEDEVGYGREPWDDRLRKGLARRFGVALPPIHAREGDVALIAYGGPAPMHVGVVAVHPDGGLSLIHAHRAHGVIEQSMRSPVTETIVEIYRPNWRAGVY